MTPKGTTVLAAVYINGAPVCQIVSRQGSRMVRVVDLHTRKEQNARSLIRALAAEVTVRKFVGPLEIRLGVGVEASSLPPYLLGFVRQAAEV